MNYINNLYSFIGWFDVLFAIPFILLGLVAFLLNWVFKKFHLVERMEAQAAKEQEEKTQP